MSDPDLLPCQRHLFDMPRDVCFMTAASWCPIPTSSVELGKIAVERKSRPWELPGELQQEQCEQARKAAAVLIGALPEDVAIIPSVGYGVATAAKALDLPAGSTVIVLADDHTSPVLEWSARSNDQALDIHTIRPGDDHDWTAAVLDAIDRAAKNGLALVSISNVHWSDGGLIDIGAVSDAARRHGAKLLIDATHAVGVLDMDVTRLDPDFLLFPTYKWLLGPYGRAFLYIADRHHGAVPLEQTMSGRKRVRAEDPVYFTDLDYMPDARRFDMGERDFFISLDMARHGMELVHSFGREKVEARLGQLTRQLARGIKDAGLSVTVLPENLRAPNILSLGFPDGMPNDLAAALTNRQVYTAPRLGRLRVAPHVYNDEQDCERFVGALGEALAETRAK